MHVAAINFQSGNLQIWQSQDLRNLQILQFPDLRNLQIWQAQLACGVWYHDLILGVLMVSGNTLGKSWQGNWTCHDLQY